ncbi:MAG: AarF/ABC1/UbiB kinase family protein [Myxococcales bacterium]|nr:AarF/ABC1/UbiB kinase family protein [Myxococcales bacterium]
MGQVLSVLGSFLPRAYTRELERLQDQVAPRPFKVVEKAFRRDREKHPDEIFKSFDRTPLAAASLGQVHVAYLAPEGEGGEPTKVAVKVLYPKIRRLIQIDMRVLRWVISVLGLVLPKRNLLSAYSQLNDVLTRETDYRLEAKNMAALAANFENDARVACPTVYEDLSSDKILVMTFMDGAKITDLDALKAQGDNPTDVARLLVTSYYKQLLIDGLFHADPHPGNFLVQPGPVLVFLDFGAVEPVKGSLKKGMLLFLQGIIGKDDDKAIEGIEEMGFISPDGDRELLEKTVKQYFMKLVTMRIDDYSRLDINDFVTQEELREVRGQMKDLMKSVVYPDGYFFIERSLLLLFGLVAMLDPKVNALELGFPYAMQFILSNNGSQSNLTMPGSGAQPAVA